jgi:hypothetical protein
MKPLAFALAMAAGASVAPDPAVAAAGVHRPDGSVLWPVSNCNDAGPGSLRDAAAHANHGDGIDLGGLACSTISVTSGAITLHDVELTGPGAGLLEIDGTGNQNRRIFNHAGGGGNLAISGVTINGGKYVSNAGLGGGCLRSVNGNLRIHDSVFRNCMVVTPVGQAGHARGGAIAAYGNGDIRLYDTTIDSSLARTDHDTARGGGLYAEGHVLVRRSTITNNSVSASGPTGGSGAFPQGGGLFTPSSVVIEDSTLDGNVSAVDAGAAFVGGGGMLVRSTISNNVASAGTPGIVMLGHDNATASIYSSTISGNVAERSEQWMSGGLYLDTATTRIINCTITANRESNPVATKFGAGIIFGRDVVDVTMSGTIAAGNYFDDGQPPYAADDIDGPESLTIVAPTGTRGHALRVRPATRPAARQRRSHPHAPAAARQSGDRSRRRARIQRRPARCRARRGRRRRHRRGRTARDGRPHLRRRLRRGRPAPAVRLPRLHEAAMNPRLPSCDVACARVAGHAAARTCAAPWTLQASTAITFDTREGASSLVLSCGAFPLAGPATMVLLHLPCRIRRAAFRSGDRTLTFGGRVPQRQRADGGACRATVRAAWRPHRGTYNRGPCRAAACWRT